MEIIRRTYSPGAVWQGKRYASRIVRAETNTAFVTGERGVVYRRALQLSAVRERAAFAPVHTPDSNPP